MKKFSIVTPVWVDSEQRKEQLLRCIESIAKQDYPHDAFEHIIVNDGSIIEVEIPPHPWIKVINQENLQRLTAYNTGFKAATGKYICMLDSDDEYTSLFLRSVELMFKRSRTKIVNFGCIYQYSDGTIQTRDAFKPEKRPIGHEVFGGGTIVNGTFVFNRKVYEDLGAFPEGYKEVDVLWYRGGELLWTSPYDFAAFAQAEFPEIQPFFSVKHPDHPQGLIKELGNPWGQDYYLFYKYTRKYHSAPFDRYLYIVHPRS